MVGQCNRSLMHPVSLIYIYTYILHTLLCNINTVSWKMNNMSMYQNIEIKITRQSEGQLNPLPHWT